MQAHWSLRWKCLPKRLVGVPTERAIPMTLKGHVYRLVPSGRIGIDTNTTCMPITHPWRSHKIIEFCGLAIPHQQDCAQPLQRPCDYCLVSQTDNIWEHSWHMAVSMCHGDGVLGLRKRISDTKTRHPRLDAWLTETWNAQTVISADNKQSEGDAKPMSPIRSAVHKCRNLELEVKQNWTLSEATVAWMEKSCSPRRYTCRGVSSTSPTLPTSRPVKCR